MEWETLVREVFLEEGGQSGDWKEGRDTSKDRDRKSSAASILPQTGYSKVSSECLPCQVWLALLRSSARMRKTLPVRAPTVLGT